MLFRSCALVLLAQAFWTAASLASDVRSPFVPALPLKYPLRGPRERSILRSPPSSRPLVAPHPHTPARSLKVSPPRNQTCYVNSHNDGVTDDASYILEAIQACNNGGHVVFNKNSTYIWGTALDLTFLNHIDLDIQGYIQFTNDTDYWQANSFKQIFQNATTFFQLGGNDVNVYGGGSLDGNGQVWYDLYAQNIYILRPILFGTVGLHSSTISNLNLIYSPQYYNWVANSSDVVFSDISISGFSKSANVAKNTDGWDTYRSDSITIQNSVINNGDDCVSFKPNSTNMIVQNMYCNGSHGISVGSLGQYKGETDIVQNVYVYNISMSNATDGARIKVWPGAPAALSGDLQGGGGLGRVENITYDTFQIDNVDYAIEVTQCYGQKNFTLCTQAPSNLTITDVLFTNFRGTASKKYEPLVGNIVCSSPNVCSNIRATNIDVLGPVGNNAFTCLAVDEDLLDVNCTAINLGYN